jgi:hypothetical protein
MIDCARLVFSVGSTRASSFRQRAEKSYISLTPTSADLNAARRDRGPIVALPIGQALCMMIDAALKMNRR